MRGEIKDKVLGQSSQKGDAFFLTKASDSSSEGEELFVKKQKMVLLQTGVNQPKKNVIQGLEKGL